MDIKIAAKILDVSEKTIRRWIKSGKLSAQIVKGSYLISSKSMWDLLYPINDYRFDRFLEWLSTSHMK